MPRGRYKLHNESGTIELSLAILERIGEYSTSLPTAPSVGRIYRRNLNWPSYDFPRWVVYLCVPDGAPNWVKHKPYNVRLFEDNAPNLADIPVAMKRRIIGHYKSLQRQKRYSGSFDHWMVLAKHWKLPVRVLKEIVRDRAAVR